jgi:hypothetical protein
MVIAWAGPPRKRAKINAAARCVARTVTRRGERRSLDMAPPPEPHHSQPIDTEKSSPKSRDFLGAYPTRRASWLDRKERVSSM